VLDIADTYDLEAGEYAVSADGALPFSGPDCTGITGVIPYRSNEIKITVSQPSNAKVLARLDRRTTLDADTCTWEHTAIVQDALKRAGDIAAEAANAALNGDARLFESFFRTADAATRKTVAARFEAIAREIKAGDNSTVTYSCGDGVGGCSSKGAIAYAVSGRNLMVNCPTYYEIAKETKSCGGKDQALTIIHELAHMSSVFKPAAGDHAYGYDAIIALPKEKAVVNADTFLYYASCKCVPFVALHS
jgi:deuterolysin